MEYGISTLAIIPVRKEAREQSEMVTQLLFGELYQITERTEKWAKVKIVYDGYEGWISNNQVTFINEEAYISLINEVAALTSQPLTSGTKQVDGTLLYLPSGSSVRGSYADQYHISLQKSELDLITFAKTFLNTSYLWGGRTHFGIDCSGFVQAVFRQYGINLHRDAYQQAEQGQVVDFLPEAKAGDVAFFDNDEGRIVHVGIMLSNEQILHASGRVKIEKIDNHGIYSEEYKRYTHKLRIIKRFI